MSINLKKIPGTIVKYFFAIIVFIFTVFPLFWIISCSLKGAGEIESLPPRFIPVKITFENYITAINQENLLIYLKNSIIVTVLASLITIVIASLGSYALTFYNFRGKKLISKSLIAIQMIPLVVIIIPLFMVFSSVKLINSYTSLVIGNLRATVPIAVVMLITYYLHIPNELRESAEIDGCNPLQTFSKVIFPLVLPGVFAVFIYTFINVWQEFLMTISFVSSTKLFTLPVGLTTYFTEFGANWGGLMATAVIITLPAIVLFLVFQNYFIDNLSGAIKG
jgi:ABC-type glycerol-3-phosphate transport system permease component